MSNILDRYFEAALRRVPPHPIFYEQELPCPQHPEHGGFDPTKIDNSKDDYLIPIEERWTIEGVFRNLANTEVPFPISNEERNLLDGSIREVGIEAYAFYKSRRYIDAPPYSGKWGIFYLEHGVSRTKELIETTYPGYGSSLRLAYEFLRSHERFHFKFDLYALSIEANIGRALYNPLKHVFRKHQIHQVEEALANRDAWEWAKQKRLGLREFTFDFMKLQPGAYARFDEKKTNLAGELAANLLDLNLTRSAFREDQALWVGNIPDGLLRRSLCPEFFVRPTSLTSWIDPLHKLPDVISIEETKPFFKSLSSQYTLKPRWYTTKEKLIKSPWLPSLDFKRWDKSTGDWSVRVNDNFRAHLRPVPQSHGKWEAVKQGSHNDTGHG